MERNPHLLFEGCLIGCYAIGAKVAYIYIRGEFYHVQQRSSRPIDEAYAAGYLGKNILGTGFDCDVYIHRGAGAYEAGEETALHRVARRQARAAAHQAAVPGRVRALQLPDRGQQRRDARATCRSIIEQGRGVVRGARAREERRAEAVLRQRPREAPGRLRSVDAKITLRELIYDERYAGGMRDGRTLKAVIPGGSSVPILLPDQIDIGQLRRHRQGGIAARLGGHHRDGRHDLHGLAGEEPAALLPARVVRQVHALPRGHATGCSSSSTKIEHGEGDDAATSTCWSASATTSCGKTLCAFGDAAATPVLTTLKQFRARVRGPRPREGLLAAGGEDVRARPQPRRPGGRGALSSCIDAAPRSARTELAHHRARRRWSSSSCC